MGDDIIDRSALDRLLDVIGGDRDGLRELIEEFQNSTPQIISKMEEAAARGDIDHLRIASHNLKANSRDFGATALGALCERLEHECKSGTVKDAAGQVANISRELAAAREALRRLISNAA